MKLKKNIFKIFLITVLCFMCAGCGATEEPNGVQVEDINPETKEEQTDKEEEELHLAQAAPYEEESEADEALESDNQLSLDEEGEGNTDDENSLDDEEYLPGYASETEFKERHSGSASLINEPTVIVSIFVDEEEDVWTTEEKALTLNVAGIAYDYVEKTLKEEYNTEVELIYDWAQNPDLIYSTRIFENISAYVETEEERHIDELEAQWVSQVPYRELMQKYETTSIAFLYFIPHEGCSYSSMHFIDDGAATWNEGCLLYLQDMYSPTLEYETPMVYAHELLHLFGAEDYYSSAEVFSKETYSKLKKECANDIMLSQNDVVNGVYTTYPDKIPREITPITAYMLGIGDEKAVKDIPELIKAEPGCFSGSTYDRPF